MKKCCPTALAILRCSRYSTLSVIMLARRARVQLRTGVPKNTKTLAVLPGKGKGLTEIGMKSLV